MKIMSLNIQRGFMNKFDQIESFVREEQIDIFILSETDLSEQEYLKNFEGFSIISQSCKKRRIVMGIKNGIDHEVISYPGTLPHVAVQTNQMTVCGIYNDFTVNKIRLTNSERQERLQSFLLWFDSIAKKKSLLIGDFNINWDCTSTEKEALQNWALENDHKQTVTEPTRSYMHQDKEKSSIIDLSFIRGCKESTKVVDPVISDHKAVIVSL